MFLGADIPESTGVSDPSLEISYKLLYRYMHEDLIKTSGLDGVLVVSKGMSDYLDELSKNCSVLINGRSPIVKGLFLLYLVAQAFDKYNSNVLNLPYARFRSKILFPNLVYILQRYLPDTRKFLQSTVRSVYNDIYRKSEKIVNLYTNSFYLDQDVIKHNILLEFLGNGLRKNNPLDIGNIQAYYRAMIKSIFNYYFKKEQNTHTVCSSFWNVEDALNILGPSARLTIYREVLYNLQVDKFYKESPLYSQLGYNYRIFKNIIINNEIQDIYISLNSNNTFGLGNNEYKLLKVYDDDLMNQEIVARIRKLPTIFKLLKCVHIINPKSKPYNEMMIKPELLKNVVRDELISSFKNFFSDGYLIPILDKIANNFVNSLLSGEYINLLTLTSVRIDQISFIEQVKKFVRICLDDISCTANYKQEAI